MPEEEFSKQYSDSVRNERDQLEQLIQRVEKYRDRQSEFQRVEERRWRAEKRLSDWPQHFDVKNRAQRQRRSRLVYDDRVSEYVKCWTEIEAVIKEVLATFERLGNQHWGPDGEARKILSHAEVELLIQEIATPAASGLGGKIPSALRALRRAAQMVDDLIQPGPAAARRGYRIEIQKWMKSKGLKTTEEAARSLGVGLFTLKSIMSEKGKKRYGDATLTAVLKKIGHKEP